MPADVTVVVVHLAECPHADAELGAWSRAIVSAVSNAADIETPAVSPETGDETRRDASETRLVLAVPDIEELAILRGGGMSYRGLANLAGVAPETVRRRIARHVAAQTNTEGT